MEPKEVPACTWKQRDDEISKLGQARLTSSCTAGHVCPLLLLLVLYSTEYEVP